MKFTELSLPGFFPLDFFSKLDTQQKNPAYFTSGEWVILAWNPTKTIRASNDTAFRTLQKDQKMKKMSSRQELPFTGGWIGVLSYDSPSSSRTREACFHYYNQALLWDGTKIIAVGEEKFRREVSEIHGRIPLSSQGEGAGVRPLPWKSTLTRAKYASTFRLIQKDIRNGEYYQLNLTYTLEAKSNIDHRELFCALAKKNPASCLAYFEDGNFVVLSCSPERFVTIRDRKIITRPIKGTRPRGKNPREDQAFKNALLKSEKEAAELSMITDLLRNDLGKVSETGSVRVKGHRLLQKNPTVWHTYSEIEGKLRADLHPLEAFQSMFPGGSITGCPKRAAMTRIAELEKKKRGPYCGCMILQSDSGFLDSTILIRTVIANGTHLSLGIGSGIVADSTLDEEFEETKQKAKAFYLC